MFTPRIVATGGRLDHLLRVRALDLARKGLLAPAGPQARGRVRGVRRETRGSLLGLSPPSQDSHRRPRRFDTLATRVLAAAPQQGGPAKTASVPLVWLPGAHRRGLPRVHPRRTGGTAATAPRRLLRLRPPGGPPERVRPRSGWGGVRAVWGSRKAAGGGDGRSEGRRGMKQTVEIILRNGRAALARRGDEAGGGPLSPLPSMGSLPHRGRTRRQGGARPRGRTLPFRSV